MHRLASRKLLIIVALLLMTALLIAAWVRSEIFASRESAMRVFRDKKLRIIAAAVLNYSAEHGSLPPAYTTDSSGRRLHSWRVLILPYLGEQELFSQIDLNEPWGSPHNRQFATRIPEWYRGAVETGVAEGWYKPPFKVRPIDEAKTDYLAVISPDGAWQGETGVDPKQFKDANPVVLVEDVGADVCWMEPRDLTLEHVLNELVPCAEPCDAGPIDLMYATTNGEVHTTDRNLDRESLRRILLGKLPKETPAAQ